MDIILSFPSFRGKCCNLNVGLLCINTIFSLLYLLHTVGELSSIEKVILNNSIQLKNYGQVVEYF